MSAISLELKQVFYVLFHPFDGFYEIRFRSKSNYYIATILMFLYGFQEIIRMQYSGFLFSNPPINAISSVQVFITTILPIILFIISNYSITTLFDGNGAIKDIYIVITYAMIPKIIMTSICIILSNFTVQEEYQILYSIELIGNIWFYFLVFCGFCVIHEYTALKNVITIVTTYIATVVITFISLLYFSVLGKIISFIYAVFSELVKR